ncbi:MAG: helix-turn-helix domain-containing protein [Chloroflexota bacterium]|nr:helix-turn-helix domain-containing protein [Chloroflexota bacterium]
MGDEFVTMREAQEILGVSKFTMWRLVREGKLAAFQSEVDRREKLIRRSDLEGLRQPRPIPAGEAKKVAA